MALPSPNLDDRRFQDLVDEAKRMVQRRSGVWTDHNVSDPGVTLIETFAYMTDLLLYRLNRVPDKIYLKFLDLLGVQLFPPNAATSEVTFWLSAPQADIMTIPRGTRTSTQRQSSSSQPIVFETVEDLQIIPSSVASASTVSASGQETDRTSVLSRQSFAAFSDPPVPGESLLIGLPAAVPSNVINLRFNCRIEGVGVNPDNPPLVWEAFDGNGWKSCEVESDSTGGLNKPGDIAIHIPRSHSAALLSGERAGWIRCRITEPSAEFPFYSSSPRIQALSVSTIGGTVGVINAETHDDELLGYSTGTPGQRFALENSPVVRPDGPVVVEVGGEAGWQEWEAVTDFSQSGPDSPHFIFDISSSEVIFGPAVRDADGRLKSYGAVPAKDAPIRIRRYQSGGGRRGNVQARSITLLKNPIPFVARVENRISATGGVDGEDLEEAKIRGPISLKSLARAVTADDYEVLSREAAPEMARIHCIPTQREGGEGSVTVLVVPAVDTDSAGRIDFGSLAPNEQSLRAISQYLDERRTVGARVMIEPPNYQGVTVVAMLKATNTADPDRVLRDAEERVYRFLSPLEGGPDGTGWPLGRTLHAGEVFAQLQSVPGVLEVSDVRLFIADPISGTRSAATQKVEIGPDTLLYPFEHQIRLG
ncbi:MAG: putative baseplate assembly protein [Actinomycetota bacterium]|nr:putative baseplate assembly protein [Actinomycetota bacterium]MDA8209600.1 putative baseplate assembly protein [Actinomycetota bacterium]